LPARIFCERLSPVPAAAAESISHPKARRLQPPAFMASLASDGSSAKQLKSGVKTQSPCLSSALPACPIDRG
jgi:hypothetical protein